MQPSTQGNKARDASAEALEHPVKTEVYRSYTVCTLCVCWCLAHQVNDSTLGQQLHSKTQVLNWASFLI